MFGNYMNSAGGSSQQRKALSTVGAHGIVNRGGKLQQIRQKNLQAQQEEVKDRMLKRKEYAKKL